MRLLYVLAAEIRALDTSPRTLRSFGRVVGAVLLGLGLFAWWRRDGLLTALPGTLLGAGAALLLLGLVAPGVLRPVYRVWMGVALVLGFVMTRVLLTVLFVLAFVPVGWLRRTFGRSPILTRPEAETPSYWIPREPPEDDAKERLERLY